MSSLATGAIDIAEAAYDLEAGAADWLQRVLDAGKQTFDLGLGAAAALMSGASPEGQPLVTQLIPGTARPGLIPAIIRAAQEMGPDMLQQTMDAVAGGVSVLSENRERRPVVYEAMTRNAGCEDFLQLWALDPDLHGVNVAIPSPKTIRLSKRAREHWTMLLIHLTAAHRLRRALIEPAGARGIALTDMPHNAEALLDPKNFRVSQAAGGAQDKGASEIIRDAAVRVDQGSQQASQSRPRTSTRGLAGSRAGPLVAGRLVRHRWPPLRARQTQRPKHRRPTWPNGTRGPGRHVRRTWQERQNHRLPIWPLYFECIDVVEIRDAQAQRQDAGAARREDAGAPARKRRQHLAEDRRAAQP